MNAVIEIKWKMKISRASNNTLIFAEKITFMENI